MKTLLVLVLLIVGIQFIPFDVPAEVPTKAESALEAPAELATILQRSCYDCHSNKTTFPRYSDIAPVSWFTKYHVKEGRDHMNFSTWNDIQLRKKQSI